MGTYFNLLTTKTIRAKVEGGRETIYLMKTMGKDTLFRDAPAWEQALVTRMDDLWHSREWPKYTTHLGAEDGWPVYERIEQSYFTDNYPSSRIFAGILRAGEGKMLTFEKWSRLKVVAKNPRDPSNTINIRKLLSESGLMADQITTSVFNDRDGEYVMVYAKNSDDIVRAKLVLSGEYEIVA